MSISTRSRAKSGFALGAVAIFIAAGSPAWAANTVGSADIIDNSIQSIDIGDGQVAAADVAANAITTGRILDGQVTGADLFDGGVGSADLQNGGVQSIDLFDGAVTAADILNGTVSLADLAPDSINGSKVAPNSLGVADIGSNAIGYDELQVDSVSSDIILDGQVRADDLEHGLVEKAYHSGRAPGGLMQQGKIDVFQNLESGGTIGEAVEFPVRLNAVPSIELLDPGHTSVGCTGTFNEPLAERGYACVYLRNANDGSVGLKRWDDRSFLILVSGRPNGATFDYDLEAAWATRS